MLIPMFLVGIPAKLGMLGSCQDIFTLKQAGFINPLSMVIILVLGFLVLAKCYTVPLILVKRHCSTVGRSIVVHPWKLQCIINLSPAPFPADQYNIYLILYSGFQQLFV